MQNRRWEDFTTGQKALLIVGASVQLSLAVSAWADLATRNAAQVKGGKKIVWAAVIAINVVGPIAYFVKGRLSAGARA